MAEVALPSGAKLVGLSSEHNSVHFFSPDDSVDSLGGVIVVGPNITTIEMDWGKILGIAIELALKGLSGSGGGGGGGGQKCTYTTTVTTDAKGTVTGVSSSYGCVAQ
jgi:hypothetical protein